MRRRLARALVALFAFLLLLTALIVLLLRWVDPPYSMYMLSQGAPGTVPTLRTTWQPLETLPAHLPLAVVAAEDQRFPQHRGFDWVSIRQAVEQRLDGGSLRGASTISQQVAKNLFLWHGRSFLRKTVEAGFTLAIEALWPKARILEVYLNLAEWGPGVYGIEAAAGYHYGIPARSLSREQAAALAAILPSPRNWSPTSPSESVARRRQWIEQQMHQLGPGWLDPIRVDAAVPAHGS
ncbi:peptidoglycan transglycosylase [Thioalkalivibrio paradoxus ARh 1]|uniref:Biosynthetic peptidoglycan transglycosylase n=1 Tax=Thioalkalivibrio paradoxus ARh 1 TaxID=713585 RepID=W0DNL7_9GAMM|nr:peptidoglycan transglycosylase [Thioalkalivibrio paradoxus ARh 1]